MSITYTQEKDAIVVRNEFWEVRHNLAAGGCWDSIKFFKGTRKNFLTGPVSARYRILEPSPQSDASSPLFYEQKFDRKPKVTVGQTADGLTVTAEGTFALKDGSTLPIHYRQRYEYRPFGLVAIDFEVTADQERNDVVEVVAADIPMRPGLTHTYIRPHPITHRSSDLVGFGDWYALPKPEGRLSWRFVPQHVVCFEKNSEGLEFYPESNLSAWDTAFNTDPGLGLYSVYGSYDTPGGTNLAISPYCSAYRRNPTKLSGATKLRYYIGLPFIKDRQTVHSPYFHAGTGSRWASDEDLAEMASAGVKLIRFHNDYRKDGPFWHDGMYPPYDAEGMKQLRRVIDTSHRLGMKVVPYISVKEFHPDSPGFKENAAAWKQTPGPTFPELHTWAGTGEFGQLMCLQSGWNQFRKDSIETILSDLPWDGLYFDWCTPHPCRHPDHVKGAAYHTDQEAFFDFMAWCRKRVGPDGIIMSHLSGLPQIAVENMSDIALIYEDLYGAVHPQTPGEFPPQCEFMPIAPRHFCAWGKVGGPTIRMCLMTSLLAGAAPTPSVPTRAMHAVSVDMVEEFKKFGLEDLASYRFVTANDKPVETGAEKVFASLYYRKDEALIYVGNCSDKARRCSLKLTDAAPFAAAGKARGKTAGKAASGKATLTRRSGKGKDKSTQISLRDLRSKGIAVNLKPYESALLKIER